MVDVAIAQEWLIKGDEDFEFATINLEEGKPFFAQICFHFQQAAEKYLKAFIIAHELEFRKIHDLPLLLKICSSKDPSFEQLREDCEYLTTFYVEARYPVHWPADFSRREAERAHHAATHIRSFVRDKLNLA
jgi:HEPN domain-containing protein